MKHFVVRQYSLIHEIDVLNLTIAWVIRFNLVNLSNKKLIS